MRPLPSALLLVATLVLSPLTARASGGLVFGLELTGGPWSAPNDALSDATGMPAFDTQNFTSALDGQFRTGVNLHLGWNVLGHAAVEAALQTSFWDVLSGDRGGVGLVGGRATWYPMQLFLEPDRAYDAGVELGYGWSIGGVAKKPARGMDGNYFSVGVTGEYRFAQKFGVGLFYRYFHAGWNKYHTDFDNGQFASADGFAAGWHSLGLSLTLHVPVI